MRWEEGSREEEELIRPARNQLLGYSPPHTPRHYRSWYSTSAVGRSHSSAVLGWYLLVSRDATTGPSHLHAPTFDSDSYNQHGVHDRNLHTPQWPTDGIYTVTWYLRPHYPALKLPGGGLDLLGPRCTCATRPRLPSPPLRPTGPWTFQRTIDGRAIINDVRDHGR